MKEETKPDIVPNNTYKMIMTVASAPRFDGDKNPSKAKTKSISRVSGDGTCSRANHHEELSPASQQNGEEKSMFRWTEDISMDQFPSRVFLNVLLQIH